MLNHHPVARPVAEPNVGPKHPTVRCEMEAVLAGARSTSPFVNSRMRMETVRLMKNRRITIGGEKPRWA
jgi:hypothetical protein